MALNPHEKLYIAYIVCNILGLIIFVVYLIMKKKQKKEEDTDKSMVKDITYGMYLTFTVIWAIIFIVFLIWKKKYIGKIFKKCFAGAKDGCIDDNILNLAEINPECRRRDVLLTLKQKVGKKLSKCDASNIMSEYNLSEYIPDSLDVLLPGLVDIISK